MGKDSNHAHETGKQAGAAYLFHRNVASVTCDPSWSENKEFTPLCLNGAPSLFVQDSGKVHVFEQVNDDYLFLILWLVTTGIRMTPKWRKVGSYSLKLLQRIWLERLPSLLRFQLFRPSELSVSVHCRHLRWPCTKGVVRRSRLFKMPLLKIFDQETETRNSGLHLQEHRQSSWDTFPLI